MTPRHERGRGGAGAGFFGRWLRRSLARNLAQGVVATASLALSSALVFCVVAVSSGVERELGKDLAGYGANLLVVPRSAPLRFGLGALELGPVAEERPLSAAELARLAGGVPGVTAVAPALLARVNANGVPTGAAGYEWKALRELNPLWRVGPRWPEAGEAMAGAAVAARLRLAPGQAVELESGGRRARVTLAAIVEAGGREDDDLFLPLGLLQELALRPGQASMALVRADLSSRPAGELARAIEAVVPGAEARTVTQVAHAEASLLAKVRRLLAVVTLALAAAAAFTVSGTLGVLLLSRRHELGLCLALGAERATVRRLLLAEAAASGAVGGLAGCALGALAAEAVALSVFGTLVPPGWAAPPLALGTSLLLALSAALWPVARALRASPCDTLRAP